MVNHRYHHQMQQKQHQKHNETAASHIRYLVAQVERIIKQDLNAEESGAYMEACMLFRHGVCQETPVLDFLRTEDYNPTAAAKRLALYWKLRKEIFEHRWLLPMNQSGAGALTPEQVDIFRTGYLQVLDVPTSATATATTATTNESVGGKIILIDHSLLPPGVSHFQPHISMYFMTVITCQDIQTNGVTFLLSVKSSDRSVMQPQFRLAQQLTSALPTKIKRIVVAQAYEYGKEYLLDYMGFQREKITQMELGKESPCIKADSAAGLLRKLEQVGFVRDCLPLEFGGTVNVRSNFDGWVRMRLTLEDIMASTTASPIRNSELANFANNNNNNNTAPPTATTITTTAIVRGGARHMAAVAASTTSPNSVRTALPRLRSHKQSQNERIEQLRMEWKRLSQQNATLRQETRRLEALLAQARYVRALALDTTTTTTNA